MQYHPDQFLPLEQEIDFDSQVTGAVEIIVENATNAPAQFWSEDRPIPGTDFPFLQERNVGGGLLGMTHEADYIGNLIFTMMGGTQRENQIANGTFYPAGSSMYSSISLSTEDHVRQLDRDLFDKCTEIEDAIIGDPIITSERDLMRKVVLGGVEMIVRYKQSLGFSISTNRRVFEYGDGDSLVAANMDELIQDCKSVFILFEALMKKAGYEEILYYDVISRKRKGDS